MLMVNACHFNVFTYDNNFEKSKWEYIEVHEENFTNKPEYYRLNIRIITRDIILSNMHFIIYQFLNDLIESA